MVGDRFTQALTHMPLVAILRGIQPSEVQVVADVLIEAGFKFIEVPLNSPTPFDSIERLVKHCPDDVLVGAGTVLNIQDVNRLSTIGASLVVTPNTETSVVDACSKHSMISMIGAMTPSEALSATAHGATAIKVFPAARLGPNYANDIKAVLPAGACLLAVGGVGIDNMESYVRGGYDGFGLGTKLYTPGSTIQDITESARDFCDAWSKISAGEQCT